MIRTKGDLYDKNARLLRLYQEQMVSIARLERELDASLEREKQLHALLRKKKRNAKV
jgi:hypothetical protein